MMHKLLFATIAAPLVVGACTDTLVYGDRTGVNIAIRADAAEGSPLEVNTGLRRSVVGYVPPRGEQSGEAVSMVSAFTIAREAGENRFEDVVTIDSAFASGEAAKTAGSNARSVEAIFERPGVTAPKKLSDQQITTLIQNWVGTDQSRASKYLSFLEQSGGVFRETGNDFARVFEASIDGRNAALNAKFTELENI